MPTFEEKYDYQEITVEELPQVYKIVNDYNLFYKLRKRSKTRRSDTVPILRYDIRSLFI